MHGSTIRHSDREIFKIKHLERQHFHVPRVIAAADRLGPCSHGHGSRATRYLNPLDAIRVMLLIRLAISIFALTLLGLAFSLSSAQSQQEIQSPEVTILSHH
jgi:hypothetical protein